MLILAKIRLLQQQIIMFMIIEKLVVKQELTIGDNVWIGANCSIVAGVTNWDNVTIGAGCTITKKIFHQIVLLYSQKIVITINQKKSL